MQRACILILANGITRKPDSSEHRFVYTRSILVKPITEIQQFYYGSNIKISLKISGKQKFVEIKKKLDMIMTVWSKEL